MTRNLDLTEAQWRKIQPLLPSRAAGRRRVDDRQTVAGIVLSLRTGCPWRELPPCFGNQNTLMSRYNRWKKDGTLARITAALGFTPPTDYERHLRQGYGTNQRAKFKRDGFNPWLYDRDDDTDLGKLAKQWESGKR
jgi:transposase